MKMIKGKRAYMFKITANETESQIWKRLKELRKHESTRDDIHKPQQKIHVYMYYILYFRFAW